MPSSPSSRPLPEFVPGDSPAEHPGSASALASQQEYFEARTALFSRLFGGALPVVKAGGAPTSAHSPAIWPRSQGLERGQRRGAALAFSRATGESAAGCLAARHAAKSVTEQGQLAFAIGADECEAAPIAVEIRERGSAERCGGQGLALTAAELLGQLGELPFERLIAVGRDEPPR